MLCEDKGTDLKKVVSQVSFRLFQNAPKIIFLDLFFILNLYNITVLNSYVMRVC
jgi:hypothetical protein